MSSEESVRITPAKTYEKLEKLEQAMAEDLTALKLAIQELQLTIKPLSDSVGNTLKDHETRIRELEKLVYRYAWIAGLLVTVISGTLVYLLSTVLK